MQLAALVSWFLPGLLLVVAAVQCVWARGPLWTGVLPAAIPLGVSAWEVYFTVLSMRGRSWDPVFHGAKVGVLVVLVAVDLAAAWLVFRTRFMTAGKKKVADGQIVAKQETRGRAGAPVLMLMLVAVLYYIALPFLGTSGE